MITPPLAFVTVVSPFVVEGADDQPIFVLTNKPGSIFKDLLSEDDS